MEAALASLVDFRARYMWCMFALLGFGASFFGCRRFPPAPRFPAISPREAASHAVLAYDRNGDRKLSAEELERSPGLQSAFRRIDTNEDGCLDATEIRGRIEAWLASGTTLVDAIAQVKLDDQALSGAVVTMVPEAFLGSGYCPCTSTTDDDGIATFDDHDAQFPGMHLGFYTVRISKLAANGLEQLPKRYNEESVLGLEIAGDKSNLAFFSLNRR